jgi:hypothetical protein
VSLLAGHDDEGRAGKSRLMAVPFGIALKNDHAHGILARVMLISDVKLIANAAVLGSAEFDINMYGQICPPFAALLAALASHPFRRSP